MCWPCVGVSVCHCPSPRSMRRPAPAGLDQQLEAVDGRSVDCRAWPGDRRDRSLRGQVSIRMGDDLEDDQALRSDPVAALVKFVCGNPFGCYSLFKLLTRVTNFTHKHRYSATSLHFSMSASCDCEDQNTHLMVCCSIPQAQMKTHPAYDARCVSAGRNFFWPNCEAVFLLKAGDTLYWLSAFEQDQGRHAHHSAILPCQFTVSSTSSL